jgi:acetyltransferase-like isoleucine patch superfamily enzyme
MIQPRIALLRHSLKKMLSLVRVQYLRALGLQLGKNGVIGKLSCDWPKNIKIGSECTIQDKVRFHIAHPFSDSNLIVIGDRVFIGQCCEFNCATKITIGNDAKIAANTTFVDVSHENRRDITINQQPVVSEEIIVGNDVWVGTGCIILKGVAIGDGSIIGAGSVVNRSVPSYQIWAGSPARFIRNRV